METRNIQKTGNGGYQCEINHPRYGWIPFTARPDDPEEYGREIYQAIVKGESS